MKTSSLTAYTLLRSAQELGNIECFSFARTIHQTIMHTSYFYTTVFLLIILTQYMHVLYIICMLLYSMNYENYSVNMNMQNSSIGKSFCL
jgi:hypothetical protein